jgi:arylsulfatase A-like enzyme
MSGDSRVKAVFVLFDSLNRGALGAYGGDAIQTPNFDRFARRSVVFDNHFVGSLPCMPARRDLHTGRLNFMHRSWGPLEPFDNSFPRLLSEAGIYSHIISDHLHYFEDGGAGYTNAFDTWDFVRGQENDPWAALVEPPLERFRQTFSERQYAFDVTPDRATRGQMPRATWKRLRHAVNRERIVDDDDFPTIGCFNRGLDFLRENRDAKNWFLQLEAFDPHEPFHAPQRFKDLYSRGWNGGILDWPKYQRVAESPDEIREIKANYAALVTMCDEQFGRLLDAFDEFDLWKDTCLILTTDHGFLLTEHDWWGKNRMPYYTEISRIPLMVAHPGWRRCAGTRVQSLTQTTDLMPTFLELWGLQPPAEVTGSSILPLLGGEAGPTEIRTFGMFGGPIGATGGRYLYYRYPVNFDCAGLNEYTLAPNHMNGPFPIRELRNMQLHGGFDFTKGIGVLKIAAEKDVVRPPGPDRDTCPAKAFELFDIVSDPMQRNPLDERDVCERMDRGIIDDLRRHDAPAEVFRHYRLG